MAENKKRVGAWAAVGFWGLAKATGTGRSIYRSTEPQRKEAESGNGLGSRRDETRRWVSTLRVKPPYKSVRVCPGRFAWG